MAKLATCFTSSSRFFVVVKFLDVSKNSIGTEGAIALTENILILNLDLIIIEYFSGPKSTTIVAHGSDGDQLDYYGKVWAG